MRTQLPYARTVRSVCRNREVVMRRCAVWLCTSLFIAAFGATLVGCTDGDKNGSEPGVYSWGFEEPIGSEGSEARLAVSASGSAVAVWVGYDGVWTNQYTPGAGWEMPQVVDGTAETYAIEPDVAIDPSGNAVAVWQAGGTPAAIMASSFAPGSGWEAAAPIDPNASSDQDPEYPRVAMGPNGDAMAVWYRSKGVGTIVASRYERGAGWSPPERIDDESTGYPYQPRGVAIDSSGGAVAIWLGDDQEGGSVFANRHTPTEGWMVAEAIDDPQLSWAEDAHLAMDGSGNAIAVWRQDYQEPEWLSLITANHFTPTGGWGTAEPIENAPFYSLEPHVAMNDNGTAMAVWLRSAHGMEQSSGVWARRFTPTDGWETEPVLVGSLGDYSTSEARPRVAVDPYDNALAVWHAYGSREDQNWSSRYTPESGWDAPVALTFSGLSGSKGFPEVGIDRTGKGVALWSESRPSGYFVVAAQYDDGPRVNPTATLQAICDATCARAEECSLDDAECVSDCMDELEAFPCDPNESALELCTDDVADTSCEDLEYGLLPYSCAHACVGDRLCEDRLCDDENPCTDDDCDPGDGMCFATPVADGTPCGPGGTCVDGGCIAEFPCTEQGIRDAIQTGGGPLTFDCDGPTTVTTSREIHIDRDVILDGEGKLTVDGGGQHTVFQLWPDGVIPGEPYSVELHNMTITGGRGRNGGIMNASTLRLLNCTFTSNEGEQGGGGIGNTGTLTLDHSTVSGNRADSGGGIANGGTCTISNSIVSDNEVSYGGRGGGIDNDALLTINDSTISGNSADGIPGAGISNSGTLIVNNSTISDNTQINYPGGGGIYNQGDFEGMGVATLTETVISGNTAYVGGGISNQGTMTLVDCTVSGNEALERGAGVSNGGTMTVVGSTVAFNVAQGVSEPEPEPFGGNGAGFDNRGTLTLVNSTVSGNVAVGGGGAAILNDGTLTMASCTLSGNTGVWNDGISGGTVRVRNTIIDGECRNVVTDSDGGNVESPGDTCGFGPVDQKGVLANELNLGALANNGGPTDTHALQSGSFAIDAVPEGSCVDPQGQQLETDQRGIERPQGPTCDAGSFEVQE